MKSTTKKILASSLGVAGAMAMGTVTAKADTTVTVNAGDSLNGILLKSIMLVRMILQPLIICKIKN